MNCDVCHRPASSKLPFLCSTCVRNDLYGLRLENVNVLLQKEELGRQVEEVINGTKAGDASRGGEDVEAVDKTAGRWTIETARASQAESAERTRTIHDHIEILKKEIKDGKEDISKRKASIAQRRSDAESANHQLGQRRATTLSGAEKSIKKTEQLWNSLHAKTSESRGLLCREAADLCGLRQRKRMKGVVLREDYAIGGVGILDLREMNNASPAQVTTCFGNIAHLLVLVSHYLSLRLPAEVTLPHRGYPLPTIFAPAASYSSRDVPFPGTTPSQSSSNSPTASRTGDLRPLPRPRPLFIDKKLPRLAKEDPAAYALFLEGVTLLAWNIAWVCRTQGIHIGSESWEDVCTVGKNLWQLLVAPPASSALMRVLSTREAQARLRQGKDTTKSPIPRTKSFPMLGHYSHGTSHSFLGSAEGVDFMRGWKLSSPIKIMDKLKSTLLGEMSNAEWELLEEKEWDDGGQPFDDEETVMVRGKSNESGTFDDAQGVITAPTIVQDDIDGEAREEDSNGKGKGTSGWTKLKSR